MPRNGMQFLGLARFQHHGKVAFSKPNWLAFSFLLSDRNVRGTYEARSGHGGQSCPSRRGKESFNWHRDDQIRQLTQFGVAMMGNCGISDLTAFQGHVSLSSQ